METFSALLVLCKENSPVTGESPSQRPVARSFDVFFDLRLNKRPGKNRNASDLRRHSAHYDVTVMTYPLTSMLSTRTVTRTRGVIYETLIYSRTCISPNGIWHFQYHFVNKNNHTLYWKFTEICFWWSNWHENWFRYGWAPNRRHFLNQWWLSLLTHTCNTLSQRGPRESVVV